jgi:hypothetical protein
MCWRRTTPAITPAVATITEVVAITRTRRSVVKSPWRRWPPFGDVIEAGASIWSDCDYTQFSVWTAAVAKAYMDIMKCDKGECGFPGGETIRREWAFRLLNIDSVYCVNGPTSAWDFRDEDGAIKMKDERNWGYAESMPYRTYSVLGDTVFFHTSETHVPGALHRLLRTRHCTWQTIPSLATSLLENLGLRSACERCLNRRYSLRSTLLCRSLTTRLTTPRRVG